MKTPRAIAEEAIMQPHWVKRFTESGEMGLLRDLVTDVAAAIEDDRAAASVTWEPFPGPRLPAERRQVLVAIRGDEHGGHAPATAVGYLRYASGDLSCPFFVVPGFGRTFVVTHWCDCLGDGFQSPAWPDAAGEHGLPARDLTPPERAYTKAEHDAWLIRNAIGRAGRPPGTYDDD